MTSPTQLTTALALLGCLLLGCSRPGPAARASSDTPVYTFDVKNVFPHDRQAFTQGLIFKDGLLWESTGQYGASSLRKVELQTGRVLAKVELAGRYFGEGMTVLGGKVYVLTWQNGKGFVFGEADMRPLGEFEYEGEGWGLTHDGSSLVMSDGTSRLRFLDPATLRVTRTLDVTDAGRPVQQLNELEYVRGEIFANVWQQDRVARIDPKTGRVAGWIDLAGLLPASDRDETTDVLNGIAYDERGDRLFVTGKLWPKLFEITLRPRK
jgi:glutaminyl-peptide cyclotransferase